MATIWTKAATMMSPENRPGKFPHTHTKYSINVAEFQAKVKIYPHIVIERGYVEVPQEL